MILKTHYKSGLGTHFFLHIGFGWVSGNAPIPTPQPNQHFWVKQEQMD